MHEAVRRALDDQIAHEFASAYFYLAACAYFESINLAGFAKWMRLQAREEVVHAMKLFDFMNDRGARPGLKALDQPTADFASPLDAFQRSLQNEQRVSESIDRFYDLAVQHHDHPTQVLLQWFITEQVEEEKNATRMVEELRLAADNPTGLLLLNSEAGRREAEEE